MRQRVVNVKLSPLRETFRDQRLTAVDDSFVRGPTTRQISGLLRRAGAREVHVRISAPPIYHPCFYGIDTPNPEELMANKMSIEQMCKAIGADSLAFVSFDGMYKAVGRPRAQHCDACFSGNYPVPIEGPRSPQLSLLRFTQRR